MASKYGINDIVGIKKQHVCGTNRFEVIRAGTDIRIKYESCQRGIMIPHRTFDKKLRKIIESHNDTRRWGND